MADSNYSASAWGPTSASTVTQGPELTAPRFNPHLAPFAQPFQPRSFDTPYNPFVNFPMSQFPDMSAAPSGNLPQGQMPYLHDRGLQRLEYYTPSSGPYPYQIVGPPDSRPPTGYRSRPFLSRPDMIDPSDANNTFSSPEHPMLRNAPAAPPPLYGHAYDFPYAPTAITAPFVRQQNYVPGSQQPHARYWDGPDSLPRPVRENPDRLRHFHMHNRRVSQQESRPHNNRTYDQAERRPTSLFHNPNRRSDRSISPQTSARRNYDRFSHDLPLTVTSSDAEELAARVPPSFRTRRISRDSRPRFHGHPQQHDPNNATPRQIQELKDKLPRRLPSEIGKGKSSTCDICAKDYSSIHVKPCEENEVAVELPCGHLFGEFCIFQWFDTSRTHKNKITCPMCRKQLLEPTRYHPALLNAISRGGPAFQEMLANELRGDFAHM
ncbi:hypothetical protein GQ44DRAFT_449205 [Phaeosphaeriaceae sp. PMI808]|nr:hypothetical protein GQ44DRAFT_449205 [Phaeosphaeriaceae sp. PMI808]